ncbi:hypothetical protein MYU51_010395 [Penicillium brevicompactum]
MYAQVAPCDCTGYLREVTSTTLLAAHLVMLLSHDGTDDGHRRRCASPPSNVVNMEFSKTGVRASNPQDFRYRLWMF